MSSFTHYVRDGDPPMCGNCRHWKGRDDASAGLCGHPNNQLGMQLAVELVTYKDGEEERRPHERNVLRVPLITTDRTTCTQHDRDE